MWKEVWRRTDPFYDRKNRENRDFENLGRLTRLQEVTLGKIQAAGGAALMVTSVEEVKAAISAEGGAI